MPRGKNHRHLCSKGPDHGEQAWLMLAETHEGQFVLEDEFFDWSDEPDVTHSGFWPPNGKVFDTWHEAMERAAEIICRRFGTDPDHWLECAMKGKCHD